VDGPRGVVWLGVLRVRRLFLSVFLSIRFSQPSSGSGSLVDGPPGVYGQSARRVLVADGPRCLHRRAIIVAAVLKVCESFSDSPPLPREQSARSSRTVRLVLRRVAKSFAS
jgi:hypothetical protein